MRRILTERNIVVMLFVMVLITFSLAQEDSKKMERMTLGTTSITASELLVQQTDIKTSQLSAQPAD